MYKVHKCPLGVSIDVGVTSADSIILSNSKEGTRVDYVGRRAVIVVVVVSAPDDAIVNVLRIRVGVSASACPPSTSQASEFGKPLARAAGGKL